MATRSAKSRPSVAFQPVDLECRRLVGATVQLCRRVPKSERYPYTELVHQYVNAAGVNINRACRVYGTEAKIGYLRKANFHLDDLRYQVEVMLTADLITAVMQSPWHDVLEVKGDYLYLAVRKCYTRHAYYACKNKQLKRYVNDTQREDQAA